MIFQYILDILSSPLYKHRRFLFTTVFIMIDISTPYCYNGVINKDLIQDILI